MKTTIGDFLFERKGKYKPSDKDIQGLRRIEKIDFSGNFHIGDKPSKTNMILVKNGDFVISGIGIHNGSMGIYESKNDVVATIHYSSYTFDKEKINLGYFKRFIKSPEFVKLINAQVRGGMRPEIKPKHLLPLEINLPSLKIQNKVVEKFENVEADIENLNDEVSNQQTLLKKLRQSILQEAIEGKLTADWREQNPDVENASVLLEKIKTEKAQLIKNKKIKNQKPLPPINKDEIPFDIPNSWAWCKIGNISNVKVGSTPNRPVNDYWNGNIHWVSSGEVANNFIYDTKETITKKGFESTSLIIYPKGSVLVAMIGQGKTRGQTSILKIDATINQNVAGMVFEYNNIVSEYVWNYFLSRYELTRSGASGGNQPALNGVKIKNILLPLPPLKEQKAIVKKIDSLFKVCDKLETQINQSKTNSETLMQAVLKEVFLTTI